MSGIRNNAEVALYYLLTLADENTSYSEEKIFEKICSEFGISQDDEQDIIHLCENSIRENGNAFNAIIREEIDDNIQRGFIKEKNPSELASIIWNLVNLGFADGEYTAEERQIVEYLNAKWKIRSEVYQEFVDIAETMLALTKFKNWIISNLSGSERDKKEKEVDNDIAGLFRNVQLTIDELTVLEEGD